MEMDESDFSLDQRQKMHQLRAGLLEGASPVVRGQEESKTFRNRQKVINIRKSLQMLDDSVMSTSTRTPRRSGILHSSTYTPIPSGSKYDVSGFLGITPRKTTQDMSALHPADRSINDSLMPTERSTHYGDFTEEVTTTNIGLLLEEDPGIAACKGLFEEFQQCRQNYAMNSQSFDLVTEYEKMCADNVSVLKKLVNRGTRNEPRFQKTFHLLQILEQEKNTWQLISSLYRDRLETELQNDMPNLGEGDEDGLSAFRKSDRNIVNEMFKSDADVRQGQLIVDWLENSAQELLECYRENIKFFSDRAVGWENTLHRLQNQEMGMSFGVERRLVDEIDPDAPVRQNRALDDLDKEDEDRLLQTIFMCIRAGQLEQAQEICRSHGQSWRAATLEGWKLYHDPNFASQAEDMQILPVEGNPHRDIWRNVCWTMSKEPRYSQYEKAIYGALSGNLSSVLPVCKSWLDYLWAHFKVLVDVKVELEIRLKKMSPRTMEKLPQEFWDQPSNAEAVFHKIEAYDTIKQEGQLMYHVIQKWLIMGNTEKLLEFMAQWVRDESVIVPSHFLRFMAHLVLFLRTFQQNFRDDLCNVILEAYVEELIQDGHKNLVSHYVATLPHDAQVHCYATFLEGIEEKEERQLCLRLAEAEGLDIPQITKMVVENIRSRSAVDFTRDLESKIDTNITEEDKRNIDAIDWLIFDPQQRAEAIKQANAVMRSFIAVRKLPAAKKVLEKLPADSIDVVMKTLIVQTGSSELPAELDNDIREYLCLRAYLDAMESFNDWFNLYHHSKPVKPHLSVGATFTEQVAHEHRMKQYGQELERWQHHLILQTKTTKGKIYNVLLFVDGGWMIDQKQVESPDEVRCHQMELLRQLVLPGLCLLLHNILHTSEQYTECLQLADIVTSENHQLYKVFRKDELQHLLQLLRDSSLANLDQNRDPLGYQLS